MANDREMMGHLLKAGEAEVREKPNTTKMVNHLARGAILIGGTPREPDQPWIAVSIPPVRTWNAAEGLLPVTLLMETPDSKVDTDFNDVVYLLAENLATPPDARKQLLDGRWEGGIDLGPNSGTFQIFAYAPLNGAVGCSPTFEWTAL